MVITSGNVSLSSNRNYSKNISGQTITTRWQANNPANQITTAQSFSYGYSEESVYNNYNDFSHNLKDVQRQHQNGFQNLTPALGTIRRPSNYEFLEESIQKTLRSLLNMLYKAKGLTREHSYGYNSNSSYLGINNSLTANLETLSVSTPTIWNQITDSTYCYEERETTSFASTGKAITADGREIDFNVSFTMSRAFKEEFSTSAFTQYEQVLTDPLVINLDSNPTTLSDKTFFFDIDSDGIEDEISQLGTGSGFLAFDKNNDGTINDGSELFGTQSGNGFFDLSQYDEDGNGWIDEADSIYKHLKVWTKDEDGNDKLINLKNADVGAIYLGSTDTTYSLTNNNNALNGLMRSTGVFLRESSGTAGTISQIDLVRHQEV